MAMFESPLIVRKISANVWSLTGRLIYDSDIYGGTITVPKQFITDFESIPRMFWWLFSPGNSNSVKPSVIHDFLCKMRTVEWIKAHKIFLEAMKANNVSWIKRTMLYQAVRWFGPRW